MTGADEQAVREVHVTWIEAVNSGDLPCLLGMVAEDVVFVGPGETPFGKEKFAVNFSAALQQLKFVCVSELEEVVVAGDVAYCRSRDSLSVSARVGGDAAQLTGYRMTVYRRDLEGGWRLARDAHTLAPLGK